MNRNMHEKKRCDRRLPTFPNANIESGLGGRQPSHDVQSIDFMIRGRWMVDAIWCALFKMWDKTPSKAGLGTESERTPAS